MVRVHQSRSLPPQARRLGFTVVELLVVIGVVSLLLGILVPALSLMREQAQHVTERNSARQATVAWTSYAFDHDGRLLPGYRSGRPASTADGEPIADQTIGVAANRYPWRLAPYLAHNFDVLYVNGQNDVLDDLRNGDYSEFLYTSATYPSLGLNTTWVGGDEIDGCFNPSIIEFLGRFYSDRLSAVRNPSKVIVFCSARGDSGVGGSGGTITEGHFRVSSPNFSNRRWEADYDPERVMSFGNVSARWGNDDEAVVSRIDGSVDSLDLIQLQDMRNWADAATDADWRLAPPGS